MKRFIILILLILTIIIGTHIYFTNLNNHIPDKEDNKLATPVITINDPIISWLPIENATIYEVCLNNMCYIVETNQINLINYKDHLLVGDNTIKVKALESNLNINAGEYSDEYTFQISQLETPEWIYKDNNKTFATVANADCYKINIYHFLNPGEQYITTIYINEPPKNIDQLIEQYTIPRKSFVIEVYAINLNTSKLDSEPACLTRFNVADEPLLE